MQLQSSRLFLKIIDANDLENIHALHSIPETDTYNTMGLPESIADTQKILNAWLVKIKNNEALVFKILDHSTNNFIGLTGVNMQRPVLQSAEIWYKLDKQFWYKGFATESVLCLLEYLFTTLHLHRIEAACAVENAASQKVLLKVGMLLEGRTRQKLPIRGEWHDSFLYAILKSDFEKII
jgi:[ribosomal protein S5]-alanine N-acetyltransferase